MNSPMDNPTVYPVADGQSTGEGVHVLKTWPEFFQAVRRGDKPFEVRRNDRDFKLGDTLWLQEWDPATQAATGENEVRLVSYVLPGGQFGVEPGFVVLGLTNVISYAPPTLDATGQGREGS